MPYIKAIVNHTQGCVPNRYAAFFCWLRAFLFTKHSVTLQKNNISADAHNHDGIITTCTLLF